MTRRTRILAVLISTATLLAAVPAFGQGEALIAKILMRALSYDRNLATRAGSTVRVAVLYRAERASTVSAKDAIESGLAPLVGHKIAGKPLQVKVIALTDAATLSSAVDQGGFSALLVVEGLSTQDINMVTAVSRAKGIASLACDREHVVAGAAIGVAIEGGKPKLLVNLPASKKESLNLSAAMLRSAEVIR